ncbi:60S ribosomal protein L35-3 [Diplonema papillatum]|nr:60S ribosomal protein L35-3 [Diplonema papillatum]KAJ9456767.1 60S ribosomal protein L35-3 [Diplonema papillatum]
MVKVRSHELRTQGKEDLLKQLTELKTELASLRVAQVTGGPATKVAKIKTVRKSIAKVLTVLNCNMKNNLRQLYRGKKFMPVDLKKKTTRAMRRALTHKEKSSQTLRQQKMAAAFPQRKFALSL